MSEAARRAAATRISLHLKGSKWRHFVGWTIRPPAGSEVYDMEIEAFRPITEDDMELAPPEAQ